MSSQKPEPPKDEESEPVHNVERRYPSSSFIDSIMVALTSEKEEDSETAAGPGTGSHHAWVVHDGSFRLARFF